MHGGEDAAANASARQPLDARRSTRPRPGTSASLLVHGRSHVKVPSLGSGRTAGFRTREPSLEFPDPQDDARNCRSTFVARSVSAAPACPESTTNTCALPGLPGSSGKNLLGTDVALALSPPELHTD